MKSAVLLFANTPLPVLTPEAMSGAGPDPLALALLKDTLRNLADVDAEVFLFLDPGQDKEQAKALLGKGRFKISNALGRNITVQQRNAFRLVFSRQYERAILVSNATPDLPTHAVQSALDGLGWKNACIGPVPSPNGEPEDIYALGFHTEAWMTEAFDQVDRARPALFRRLETLMLFYERKVHILPEYAPITDLTQCPALVERCRETRFAQLPSLRLAGERSA
ncbi:MAG: DUF2064 domain-containing protein [Humidesulfovibrio sp.]|uniref:DUF2064 domain-containing protein n=1 Tax=Humidesulfovibrio sp. TaxID=2910988 RepID=UPI0027F16B4E|nr:DUF2064 domain-containing protein [Humidesulfovibrio sp.]MDQ7834123.1 DUF2064 domain-containing protein [Humidesulfovibrio sp.]